MEATDELLGPRVSVRGAGRSPARRARQALSQAPGRTHYSDDGEVYRYGRVCVAPQFFSVKIVRAKLPRVPLCPASHRPPGWDCTDLEDVDGCGYDREQSGAIANSNTHSQHHALWRRHGKTRVARETASQRSGGSGGRPRSPTDDEAGREPRPACSELVFKKASADACQECRRAAAARRPVRLIISLSGKLRGPIAGSATMLRACCVHADCV